MAAVGKRRGGVRQAGSSGKLRSTRVGIRVMGSENCKNSWHMKTPSKPLHQET